MEISLFTLTASIKDPQTLDKDSKSFLEEIEELSECRFKIKGENFDEYENSFMPIIYVRTGGSESLFKKVLNNIKGNVRLLTSSKNNSLAAAMEILAFLKKNGRNGEILQGRTSYIAERIRNSYYVEMAKEALKDNNLGIIGKPSDWLISSDIDADAIKEKLGINLIDISMDEFIETFRNVNEESNIDHYDLGNKVLFYLSRSAGKEIEKYKEGAFKIYKTLNIIIEKYNLKGFTIRCFDLLPLIKNTGCFALAIFNAAGIPAGCEGDIPALLTMAIGNALTSYTGFLANPEYIDSEKGEITFAHCTAPLNMIDSYQFDTHFESGIGIAIKGEFEKGPATIAKVSGDLKRYYFKDVTLLRNQSKKDLCRTQIVLKGDDFADYFLNDPISNHHIIFSGHNSRLFNEFMNSL